MVLSCPLDQVVQVLLPFGRFDRLVLLQIMSVSGKEKSSEDPKRICAMCSMDDDLTRVISKTSFYMKQISWCIDTVGKYWSWVLLERRGVWPEKVHMTIRFCISWLLGSDATTWSARKVHHWLQHNVGVGNVNTSLMYVAWSTKMDPCPLSAPGCAIVPDPRVYHAISRLSLPPPRRYEPYGPSSKRRAVAAATRGKVVTSVNIPVVAKDIDA